MSQTPYDPASARAAALAHTPAEKPLAVKWAVRCLWTSAALTLLQGVPLLAALPRAAVGTTVLSLVVTTGLLLLIATMVSRGRSWARGLFVVIYLLGAAMLFSTLTLTPKAFQSLPPLLQILE